MRRCNRQAVLAALACLAATSCGVNPSYYSDTVDDHFARREIITRGGGDAVANNSVLQMRDPWPVASANRNLPTNGAVAAAAIQRYRTGKVIQPRGIETSSVGYGQQQQSQAPASSGPSGSPGNP